MTCGLCKRPIRGDERYVTDHYRCSADLAQSFRDDIAELLAALKTAVSTIRSFHDIGVYSRSKRDDDEAWALYQASPEMQQINAAIAKVGQQ